MAARVRWQVDMVTESTASQSLQATGLRQPSVRGRRHAPLDTSSNAAVMMATTMFILQESATWEVQ